MYQFNSTEDHTSELPSKPVPFFPVFSNLSPFLHPIKPVRSSFHQFSQPNIIMPPKFKRQEEPVSPLIHPSIDFHNIPLVDRDYKIHETLCEFELFEIYCWLEEKFLDKYNDIGIWESSFPNYIFPCIHSAPEFVRKCHDCYVPNQRVVISPTGEILFTIIAQSIDQMMQAPIKENATPFSHEVLTELYQKLDFEKRAKTLELFLTEDAPLPKKNPPYPSSIFLERAKKILTFISYLLGYYLDQWVDEAIIGFLSIFSIDSKPSILFNFSQFLADSIHEQFAKFQIKEVFKYASLLVYMFLYFQGDKLKFALQKLDDEGNHQSMIFWTTLVK